MFLNVDSLRRYRLKKLLKFCNLVFGLNVYAYLDLFPLILLFALGFLYMDVHDTSLITDVQYLAPLMAYFNSKLCKDSKVLTLDDGE